MAEKKRGGIGCWTVAGGLFAMGVAIQLFVGVQAPRTEGDAVVEPSPSASPIVSPGIQMRRDQRRLRSDLRDPDSAQFGQTYQIVRDGLPITCGYVNAKNAFGGYTGERMWIVIADLNVAVVETPGEEREFGELWNKYCASGGE